jgi:hypothetical protein
LARFCTQLMECFILMTFSVLWILVEVKEDNIYDYIKREIYILINFYQTDIKGNEACKVWHSTFVKHKLPIFPKTTAPSLRISVGTLSPIHYNTASVNSPCGRKLCTPQAFWNMNEVYGKITHVMSLPPSATHQTGEQLRAMRLYTSCSGMNWSCGISELDAVKFTGWL